MKHYLTEIITAALTDLGITPEAPPLLEKPRQAEHGDLTSNIAMVTAKAVKRKPRDLAEEILKHMEIDSALVSAAEIAGPGFLNFRFTDAFFRQELRNLLHKGDTYGRSTAAAGKTAQVEFVSANPTGPLTVGHGWNAVIGDTVSNILEWMGYDVTREYYFNNAGRQMRVLGDSVRLRYLDLLGEGVEFPEDYYQGGYIRDIAGEIRKEYGDSLRDEPAEGLFKRKAEEAIFADIKRTVERLGIRFRSFFNENSLYDERKIEEVLNEFRKKNLAYDEDGAVWFKGTEFGRPEDKVIVKSTGEPTYRLPDIAYHREKYRRGYDLMVDVLGSDHAQTYPDVLAGLQALGYDPEKMRFLIHQFATVVQDGEIVKMSTRKANFITLDQLIDEVGPDVVRYFFLMRSITSHMKFDLGLAKQQSDENPVYYLQYAHARISSIIRYAEQEGRQAGGAANLELLREHAEIDLIKLLIEFPEVVEACASGFEPHHLAEYMQNTATAFHRFYHECRVVTDDAALTSARLALCVAARTVLRNGFRIFGISAPERM